MKFSRYFIYFFIFISIYFCFFYNKIVIKNETEPIIINDTPIPTQPQTQPQPQTQQSNIQQTQKQQIKETIVMDKLQYVKQLISNNKLVLFSKTYCPYCKRVKQLFNDIGAKPFVVELDVEEDGAEIQSILLSSVSKSRTVPQVFISNKFIGGCDDTHNLHNEGKLLPLLKEASAL